MLINITDASFRYGENRIFDNVTLQVNEGDSIALVGANGIGKSTLLSCIVGESSLFGGTITLRSGLSVGYLKQNAHLHSLLTVKEEMMTVFAAQTELLFKLDEAAKQMSVAAFGSREYAQVAEKYHKLTLQADASEAYLSTVKVNTVLNGMGMAQFADRQISSLSGGERTKAALCKLLLQRPELMILDEPTNHLDYKTLAWLEDFLSDRRSALIIVSHDRYFLDKLCTSVWDMTADGVYCYKGNYTKYKQLKAERTENLLRQREKQQREIAKLSDYVARNKVRASTADMAKSREKALERMQIINAPSREQPPPRFVFECGTPPSEFPLTINELTLTAGEKVLLNKCSFKLRRGEKMALLGLNGSGKSTLIRHITQNSGEFFGKIVYGKNVRVGFYDQENQNLDVNLTVLDQLWSVDLRMSQTEVRNRLAQVNLGADDVYKRVGDLSGGERARLGLAMVMAKDCNLLLLDEPTNHLDLPAREALEEALRNYEGTLLFVSHDRYFVNGIADKIAELDGGSLTLYQGNYDDFANKKMPPKAPPKQTASHRTAKQRAEQTNRAQKIKSLEREITQLEGELQRLQSLLTDVEVVSNYEKLSQVMAQNRQTEASLSQAVSLWEQLLSEQE